MTAFVLSHQLAIGAVAVGLAVLGAVLHVRDARQAGRKAAERAAAYAEFLSEAEIDEILTGTDRRQP